MPNHHQRAMVDEADSSLNEVVPVRYILIFHFFFCFKYYKADNAKGNGRRRKIIKYEVKAIVWQMNVKVIVIVKGSVINGFVKMENFSTFFVAYLI